MSNSPTPPRQMRLLFVDDDAERVRSVLAALHSAKMACQHSTSDRFKLDSLTQLNPHLVILHLGLPDIGSAGLCTQIRAQSRVPIVILSQRTRREDQFHFLNGGADDFIAMRPPDLTLMLVRILTLLRRVYEYDRPPAAVLPAQPVASQIPGDWVTCESCGYMGPSHRFEKTNAQGGRLLSCPNCNRPQSLRFNL